MCAMVEESTEDSRGGYMSLRGCMRQQDEELEKLFNLLPDQVLPYAGLVSPRLTPIIVFATCVPPWL